MFERIIGFIREIYNQPEGIIPLHSPVFTGNEKQYLDECIDSTFVSSVGKYVEHFENQITGYTHTKKAVAIVNGTSALHLALRLVDVKPGNEVITQPLSFIATANAITYCSAVPVFVDIDKDTLGLSPHSLEGFLYNNAELHNDICINKKTGRIIKACIPVHTFGHPCRIDEIVKICDHWKIVVVEDAAESIGSFYKKQHTGTFGKIGILSFNGNKTITTGGGGMIITDDEELGIRAKHLSTQAKVKHPWEFFHDETGYNYRMPNINAALGVAQMENISNILENKRQTAHHYLRFFENTGITFFKEPEDARSNYWLNSILLNDSKEKDVFLEYSNKNGVMTRPAWKLTTKLPMYKSCLYSDLSNAESIENCLVNIPSGVRSIAV